MRAVNPSGSRTFLYQDERLSGWREHKVYRLPGGEVVTLYDDVSNRKATEERLREAQRLEVLGQLTGRSRARLQQSPGDHHRQLAAFRRAHGCGRRGP